MKPHDCWIDPRVDCEACEAEQREQEWLEATSHPSYWSNDEDGPDPADREPTAEQERAWDRYFDDLRGHVLTDAHEQWRDGETDPLRLW